MNTGLIGAIIGSAIGLAGGLFGTYCSIKNTNGPRERHFMFRSSLVCWLGISTFLGILFFVPHAREWVWYPYFILLPVGVIYMTRRQKAIRREEQS